MVPHIDTLCLPVANAHRMPPWPWQRSKEGQVNMGFTESRAFSCDLAWGSLWLDWQVVAVDSLVWGWFSVRDRKKATRVPHPRKMYFSSLGQDGRWAWNEELSVSYLGRKGWVALTWTQTVFIPHFPFPSHHFALSPSSFWVLSISPLFSWADRLSFLLPLPNLLFTSPLQCRPPAWQPAL